MGIESGPGPEEAAAESGEQDVNLELLKGIERATRVGGPKTAQEERDLELLKGIERVTRVGAQEAPEALEDPYAVGRVAEAVIRFGRTMFKRPVEILGPAENPLGLQGEFVRVRVDMGKDQEPIEQVISVEDISK